MARFSKSGGKMRVFGILLFLGLFVVGAGTGFAGTITTFTGGTATVTTSLGPNPFCAGGGDPNCTAAVAGYIANAINDLPTGSQTGNFGTDPTAYNIFTAVNPVDNLVTNYPSWRGTADPVGTFANQEGSRLFFGLVIVSSTPFSLSQLSYVVSSTDGPSPGYPTGDAFGVSGAFSSLSVYDAAHVGYVTGNPTPIESGSATQLINELIYIGVSPAWNGADPKYTGSDSTKLSAAISDVDNLNGGANYNIQICYSLTNQFGTGTSFASGACGTETMTPGINSQELGSPEPGTSGLLGFGLACMLVISRRLAKRLRS